MRYRLYCVANLALHQPQIGMITDADTDAGAGTDAVIELACALVVKINCFYGVTPQACHAYYNAPYTYARRARASVSVRTDAHGWSPFAIHQVLPVVISYG